MTLKVSQQNLRLGSVILKPSRSNITLGTGSNDYALVIQNTLSSALSRAAAEDARDTAAGSATSAAASASNASGSAVEAAGSAAASAASAVSAATSEANASSSAANAAGSAAASAASAVSAATSEANASSSAANAAGSAAASAASAVSAATSETNASNFKASAETARDKAQAWADETEDIAVEAGKYSARHWALKAQQNAIGVSSVAGRTGAVSLDATDVAETVNRKWLSDVERAKLGGVAEGANNYAHPSTHAPSIITQDINNRFVTDTEKAVWNGHTAANGTAVHGLKTAATRDVGLATGNVMEVGAFGLGGSCAVYAGNIDTVTLGLLGRVFFSTGTTQGTTPGALYGVVDTYGYIGDTVTQDFTEATGVGTQLSRKWRRTGFGSIWSPWRQVYDQGSILGTVSQSAGVPTGAIIERGSNANGEYVRFADGTQICTSAGSVDLSTTAPQYFPFPSSMTGVVAVFGGNYDPFSGATTGEAWAVATANITGNQNTPGNNRWSVTINAPGTGPRAFRLGAIGRWF